MSENGSLNPMEQNEMLQKITLLLTHTLPPGWGECQVVHRSLGSHTETVGQIRLVTGPGLPFPLDTLPDALGALFEELRAGMYAPGLGTWFAATFKLTFPFAYEVRYDREGEPRWLTSPPPQAFQDELARFPRAPEHTPEWLGGRPAREMPVAKPFDGTAPDGRPQVRRPEVPVGERDAMLNYLTKAPIVLAARGFDNDLLDPSQAKDVPLTYHTDGTWIWPGAVGYYLRAHGVPPEPALADHIRRSGFQVPEVPEAARSAAVSTITGS
ncbi:hypothetical protein [Actinomadura algeriensis]|uniref:Uncharacterized protein n=1 Tax=Actinomadura algeriensis TaxID=1679523 RepID=A0ABR9JRZ8_9ACTN|nr:hypothetical protein [Actinomadura algeriensis]MBE1533351.1 hypothetical protein [Actinomadura algeriensis]